MSKESIQLLMSMGFDESQASIALKITAGNVEQAANYLLSPTLEDSSQGLPTPAPQADGQIDYNATGFQGTISQYTVPNGRSACTCMALAAAESFLLLKDKEGLDASFLDNAIKTGSQAYAKNINGPYEHMSAEEALPFFPNLQQVGSIRQGILTNDDLGFQTLLGLCQQSDDWICCAVTKSPETVLVILPPLADSSRGGDHQSITANAFMIVDSHPRPPVTEQSSITCHTSLGGLVYSLNLIFPAMELGDDIPELMATMYNSFDICTLKLR